MSDKEIVKELTLAILDKANDIIHFDSRDTVVNYACSTYKTVFIAVQSCKTIKE